MSIKGQPFSLLAKASVSRVVPFLWKNMENKTKYFIYARKSTESEDRQVASIESQINELNRIAKEEKLEIVDILSESKSAKAPGRPIFNQMMEKFYTGEVQGIICWKLDRLARNPVDGGRINWMLQQGVIKHIRTHEKSYFPTDNVLMISVEFGMANQFIRDLSQNTKRGLKSKAEKGWLPGVAPLGYLNNKFKEKGEKDIIKDTESFDLIKRLWNLLLGKNYSIQKLYEIATGWGLKTRTGDKVSRSKFYEIFHDPFYCGYFNYGGTTYKGKHEPIITKEEYELAKEILDGGSLPTPRKKHCFAFTRIIKCGECGAMITAETKTKKQKNGNEHKYIYYHCTKKKKIDCSQTSIEKNNLEKQILNVLSRVEIPIEFHQWVIQKLKRDFQEEKKDRNKILKKQKRDYNACIKKIDKLLEIRINSEITEEEFLRKKLELLEEKSRAQELLNDTDRRIEKSIEKTETIFNFAKDAKTKFENGTIEDKKKILSTLGQNLTLKDGRLNIDIQKPLILIENAKGEIKKAHKKLEPLKKPIDIRELDKIYSQNPVLGGRGDSNSP